VQKNALLHLKSLAVILHLLMMGVMIIQRRHHKISFLLTRIRRMNLVDGWKSSNNYKHRNSNIMMTLLSYWMGMGHHLDKLQRQNLVPSVLQMGFSLNLIRAQLPQSEGV
jgi:hypothetical protein